MNKKMEGMDFPYYEGISVSRAFPRIQFDRKLGAELALGETVDITEKALEIYLRYAEIPEQRWGDISLIVTGAEDSSYLRYDKAGCMRGNNERGFDVVIKTGYCIDSDATLRHELCHVKDAIDGKVDACKMGLLYRMGVLVSKEELRKQTIVLNTLGALAYICGMYFNSEELKEGVIYVLAPNNILAAMSLGAHLKGYYHNPWEERAREAEKKGDWLYRAFVRHISAESVNEVTPFLSHPWTSAHVAEDDYDRWSMQQAAKVFGLSCYATTDKKEIELLVAKEAEKKYLEHKQLAKRGTVDKSYFRELSVSKIADELMGRADAAVRGGGAVVAIVPDSIRSINLSKYFMIYHYIKDRTLDSLADYDEYDNREREGED